MWLNRPPGKQMHQGSAGCVRRDGVLRTLLCQTWAPGCMCRAARAGPWHPCSAALKTYRCGTSLINSRNLIQPCFPSAWGRMVGFFVWYFAHYFRDSTQPLPDDCSAGLAALHLHLHVRHTPATGNMRACSVPELPLNRHLKNKCNASLAGALHQRGPMTGALIPHSTVAGALRGPAGMAPGAGKDPAGRSGEQGARLQSHERSRHE
jgi:hypothetical protein